MRPSKFTAFVEAVLIGTTCVGAQSSRRIAAEGGEILITPILYSSVQIGHGGTVVHIDPWTAGDLASAEPAFSGMGECVPEIRALEEIDLAFVPMNLPLDRMRPVPVAVCVKTFRPEAVCLIYYDSATARWFDSRDQPRPDNAEAIAATIRAFRDALEGEPIEVFDSDWYPPQ